MGLILTCFEVNREKHSLSIDISTIKGLIDSLERICKAQFTSGCFQEPSSLTSSTPLVHFKESSKPEIILQQSHPPTATSAERARVNPSFPADAN